MQEQVEHGLVPLDCRPLISFSVAAGGLSRRLSRSENAALPATLPSNESKIIVKIYVF